LVNTHEFQKVPAAIDYTWKLLGMYNQRSL